MTQSEPKKQSLRVIRGDLPTQLANMIGRRILNGELRPGDQLPAETELLEQTGVSRTTMREAIKLLVSKGLVEAKPKFGTRVRPSTDWSLLDPTVLRWQFDNRSDLHELLLLFEIRRIIEPEAAALAAQRGKAAKTAAIGRAYDTMAAASQTQINLIEADVAFHLAVLDAAENKYFLALGTMIEMAITATARFSRQRPGGLQHALPAHKTVYDSILSQRPEVARAQMRALIDDAQEDMKMVLARLSSDETPKTIAERY
ncbi:MAG: FadR/GntR family transcriptional regulator [Cypionkella sp.]